MADNSRSGKLAVILHADVAGSTGLVQQNEQLAHERILETFHRFGDIITKYHGHVSELRGDALLAEFERASDAVTASLAFQANQKESNAQLKDEIQPIVRIGIAMGEVIIADDTVTGTGVVLAQPLEQLAEPGSVVIQGAAYETIPGRFPYQYESLGEHVVKGFDQPIRVYVASISGDKEIPPPASVAHRSRSAMVTYISIAVVAVGISLAWFKPWEGKEEVASVKQMAFPLPDKPSIVVLPFNNLSDDAQQEYFVDGMTEDLITDLSKLSGLFVIARNSAFTYKGKSVEVREVAEQLGVRYVLEGSVRRAGEKVRINAQLIDATTAGHMWAERYDGSLTDVFALQDEVTQNIVAALAISLTSEEKVDRAEVETAIPEAYDAFLQGWEHYRRDTADDYAKAVSYLERVTQLDPSYGRARSALAAVYWDSAWRGWSNNLGLTYTQTLARAKENLEQAKASPNALTHQVASGIAAFYEPKPTKALDEAERAIALDSNDPAGYVAMANALLKAEKPTEAAELMAKAMRLDPHFPASYLTRLGRAQFDMSQFEEAVETLERAITRNPSDDWSAVYLAAAYGHLGQEENAKLMVENANILRARAGWSKLALDSVSHWKWAGNRKLLREGLKQAGVKPGGTEWLALVSSKSTKSEEDVFDTFSYEVKGATTIDVATAKSLHDRRVPFIDVSDSYLRGHVPGAYFLEGYNIRRSGWEEFNEVRLLEVVDKSQEVVIYTSQGREDRAGATACAQAVVWGFKKVYYFYEGFPAWKAEGFPIEKGSSN